MADTPSDPRLGRRLVVLRVAALGAAGAAAAVGSAEAAGLRVGDPEPAARATPVVTDNDPYDAAGYGRGYYRQPPPRYYYAPRQVSDSDPYDAAGRGRGYGAPPPRRSVSDSDPYDAAGRGRGY